MLWGIFGKILGFFAQNLPKMALFPEQPHHSQYVFRGKLGGRGGGQIWGLIWGWGCTGNGGHFRGGGKGGGGQDLGSAGKVGVT